MGLRTHLLVATLLSYPLYLVCGGCEACEDEVDAELAVTPISPEDGAVLHTLTATLIWEVTAVEIADYDLTVWVSLRPDFSGSVDEGHYRPGENSHETIPLEPATAYYWRVDADGYATGGGDRWASSRPMSFTTADELWAAGQVHDPSPDSAAVDVDVTTAFGWEVSNPGAVEYRFDFRLGVTADPPLVAIALDTPEYSHTEPLEYETLYYWRVAAFSGTDTTQGPLWEFTTEAPNLPVISNPNPANEATGVDTILSVAWDYHNPRPGAIHFDLYLGTTMDPPPVAAGLSAAGYGPMTLSSGTPYYWRIVAYNAVDTVAGPVWNFTTLYTEEDEIFCLLEVDAHVTDLGLHLSDELRARFDAELALTEPVAPLQATSVFGEEHELVWQPATNSYLFESSLPFIEAEEQIDFVVSGNADVPDLTASIDFPACSPAITSPEASTSVSMDGFDVTWKNLECGTFVWLTIIKYTGLGIPVSSGIWVRTENDGAYTFSAEDLAPLGGVAGDHDIVLILMEEMPISAPGYMEESLIRVQSIHTVSGVNIR